MEDNKSCPCNYLDKPCKSDCTCKNPFSSAGCEYCCTYGSDEQKKIAAHHIDAYFKLASIYVKKMVDVDKNKQLKE